MRSIFSPPSLYNHPIPSHVVQNARALTAALAEGTEQAQGPLHALLLSVLAHDQAEGGDLQEFSDLTARSLVLFGIHPDCRWHDPANITPILARIKWAIRVVVFTEVVDRCRNLTEGRERMR